VEWLAEGFRQDGEGSEQGETSRTHKAGSLMGQQQGYELGLGPGEGVHGGCLEALSSAHLVQHRVALGSLPLPEQHQASNDVRRHDVKVPEKFSKEVGNFRVGIL
jgi:hypothetical protein